MGPKRKKSKPNPEEQQPVADAPAAITTPDVEAAQASAQPATPTASQPSPAPNRSSWYGPWRSASKAMPVAAQLAKESISVAKGATSESSESSQPPRASLSKIARGSSRKSIPLAAEATKVHATSDAADKSRPRFPSEEKLKSTEEPVEVVVEAAKLPPEPEIGGQAVADTAAGKGAWFAWWSRPDGYGSDEEKRGKRLKLDVEAASSTPLPGTPNEESTEPAKDAAAPTPETSLRPEMQATQSTKSWFGLWSSTQNQPAAEGSQADTGAQQQRPPDITISADPKPSENDTATAKPSTKKSVEGSPTTSRASGWAFWSSERATDLAPTPGGTQKQIGELAVADTPSQSHPEAAQFNEQHEQAAVPPPQTAVQRSASLLKPKRGKPAKGQTGSDSSAVPTRISGNSAAQTPTPENLSRPQTPPLEASSILSRVPEPRRPPREQERPNLILPTFQASFPPAPNPTYIERLTAYLAQTLRIPGTEPQAHPFHVYRSSSLPKIKKAVALGVHGFFPAPLIQRLIGQPKGTSVRFANYAAAAVKSWCEQNQPEIKNVEIEKVALEGEGLIADRVATLWRLLLNWLDHLRKADFIFVACHSQGTPVAMMLIAKLIQLGCLGPNVRIGVCAMAGINLGPFLEYKSRLFAGSALELFDFNDPNSTVSRAYADSLDICLRHGVRVNFAGSIDDQLVSLESSLHTPLHHPYVMRTVFIDGRLHAPNFLTHLVVFAAKLRNRGVNDHGLIRELSAPLAGSLVGGEGHSRIYDEPEVYQTAIQFALESTDVQPQSTAGAPGRNKTDFSDHRDSNAPTLPTSPALANHLQRSAAALSSPNLINPTAAAVAPVFKPYETPPSAANTNPFYLPWAVRGLLEEDLVKSDEALSAEVRQLVKEFEDWRPTSKVLKDVRWRLEGVRGMMG